jgi:hypothetical protein
MPAKIGLCSDIDQTFSNKARDYEVFLALSLSSAYEKHPVPTSLYF